MNQLQVISLLGRKFPKRLAYDFDFPGYQTGRYDKKMEVRKVFLCLDFTEACMDACKKFRPDLILTHHPFFFGKKKEIYVEDPMKKALDIRINNELDCPIFSYHTNFDVAKDGMNDTILSILGWKCTAVAYDGLMRIAVLDEPMKTEDIASLLIHAFSFDYLGYLSTGKIIRKIGLIAGGGANDFMTAIHEDVDLYISGDCSHHSRLDMRRYGLDYIELPHECEELGFLSGMKNVIRDIDSNIEVECFAYEKYFSLRTKEDE